MKRNVTMSAMKHKNEEGFVLVTALLTMLILLAIATLVFTVSTKDVRISSRIVGEQRAFAAVEAGIHTLITCSNANSGDATSCDNGSLGSGTFSTVDASTDPDTRFKIEPYSIPGVPATVSIDGYDAGKWGQNVYGKRVTGENTRYNSKVEVDVGIGSGLVSTSTVY